MAKREGSVILAAEAQGAMDRVDSESSPPASSAMYATRRPSAEPDETAAPRLSAREFEVLSWLAHGKSGSEISLILGISVPTVRIHIRNIFRKLEAANIPHAVARTFLCGIL